MKRLVLDGLTLTDPHIDELTISESTIRCLGKTSDANVISGLRRAHTEIRPGDVVGFHATNDGRTVESVGTVQIFELKRDSDSNRDCMLFVIAIKVGIG